MLLALVFLTLTTTKFFLMNALVFMLVAAAVIPSRAASYAIKSRREDLGLACFGTPYVGFGIALFGGGLLQTPAGCLLRIEDCYQPTVPSCWLEAKVGVNLGLTTRNGSTFSFVYLNIRGAVAIRSKI